MTDVKTLVGYGWGFVSGRVTAWEPAFFNTADGSAPEGFLSKGARLANFAATAFTPYVVDVDRVLTGSGDTGVRRALAEGGTVGCVLVTVDGAPRLAPGASSVLVLADAKDVDRNDLKGLQRVHFAWPIDASGVVATADGPLTLDALSDIIQKAEIAP